VPPMLPAPMIPMFMLAPYTEVSEQHFTRVAGRRGAMRCSTSCAC
jgi:hypothetical protein